jgi:hypothetical protein
MIGIPENDHRNFQKSSTWIPLFEVDNGDTILYLTPGSVAQTVDGHKYTPFPIIMEELSQNDKGNIGTVKLVASDIEEVMATSLKTTGSIDGNDVVFKIYSIEIDEIVFEERLQIIHCGPIIANTITFELGMFNPYVIKLLQEKFYKDYCWNRYKQRGCWITKRDGTFSAPSVFIVGNELRINSFPGIPGSGGFV